MLTQTSQKYSVNQFKIEILLSWVKAGEIAIPEIQRPFVWSPVKVRDLMDSLYQGYPVGYLIIWKNPNVKLKDGSVSAGKKILIDGQQRVTALMAAILGREVVNEEYSKKRIKIAFNPLEEGRFEVWNPALAKNPAWIQDIAEVFAPAFSIYEFVEKYCDMNELEDKQMLFNKIYKLHNIMNQDIGIIDLSSELDIETVTEIFIRINSQGVELNQADFAMSKITVNEKYNGPNLRKAIDYFCHLAIAPEFYPFIKSNDTDFVQTDYFKKMEWLKNEIDDLYDPRYTDMLRVAFTSEFKRGKLADLVSLLSGRNFETRVFEDSIVESSFEKLEHGIMNFMNETHFKRFLMIIRSAGFIDSKMITSMNNMNFAFALYLFLRAGGYDENKIESHVRRWFVMSVLTSRYSGSSESQIDYDIRNIATHDFEDYLKNIEESEFPDVYWEKNLPMNLVSAFSNNNNYVTYLAAQVKANDKGFLSNDITVRDMIMQRGDKHHIFPKEYLKKAGKTRKEYNQVANYVYLYQPINIKIGKKAVDEYFPVILEQCQTKEYVYGNINDIDALKENFRMNCMPWEIFDMTIDDYEEFLELRRVLMAKKIREYYYSL